MDIFSIIAIALVGCILAITLSSERPEMALIITIITGVVILLSFIPQVSNIISTISGIASKSGISDKYVSIIIKVTGIACVTTIASAICKDAGQSSIGLKIEFAGRIAIIILALPVIDGIFQVILNTIVW